MKRYLIAVDLDGTLLYDFDTISDDLAAFMIKVQGLGHKVVIATGRPYRSSKFAYEKFKLDTPIINYNGGLITHPLDPSFEIVNHTADKDVIIDIVDGNDDHIRNAFCEVRDAIYLYREEKAIEPLLHVNGASLIKVGHFSNILEANPNGAIIIGKQGRGKQIAGYIATKHSNEVLSRVWDLKGEYDSIVEVYTKDSNKGQGLQYVAAKLGFEQQDIIAIGDGHNDIEMLSYAGLGVAMANS
ncbi:MAG: Cof-type HAD-IIB family hydrolase, partial [Bacilli bacterium]|nr:Cof-type HAD-IIB family hydrolase [Bacilli bacterium]